MSHPNNLNLNEITSILCDFANKNLDCVDKVLEENRIIQSNILCEDTLNNESVISLLNNIINRNFILAERCLDQNQNIHQYLTNMYMSSVNTNTNTNTNANANTNTNTNTNGYRDFRQTRNNNISMIAANTYRVLFDNLPGLATSDISYNIQYLYDLDTSGNGLGFLNYVQPLDTSRTSQFFYNLEPVPIVPNEAQIENSVIRNIRYGNVTNPINQSCPISTEPFNDNSIVSIIRNCRHVFNSNELSSWFQYNCICPVCRYDIRNIPQENTPANTNTNANINTNTNANINTNTNANMTWEELGGQYLLRYLNDLSSRTNR